MGAQCPLRKAPRRIPTRGSGVSGMGPLSQEEAGLCTGSRGLGLRDPSIVPYPARLDKPKEVMDALSTVTEKNIFFK